MLKDIKFRACTANKTDIECADGEIAIAYNLCQATGGGLRNSIMARATHSVPKGYIPIVIHETAEKAMHLIAKDKDDNLYWCKYPDGETGITTQDMTLIGTIPNIRCTADRGDHVIIGTDEGMTQLLWNGRYYNILPMHIEPISIDFGLQKAGNLVTNETIVTDAETSQVITVPGSGASRPHQATSEAQQTAYNIGKAVATSYENALASQVNSKGYFHQPFFISYAIRLIDGTRIMASSPILMLPTTLPPIIGISSSAGQDDKTYINIDLTANNYFEIRYRINGSIDDCWRDIVAAIDIYASAPITTYQTDKIAEGYVTSQKSLISTTDTGGYNRGRHYPSRGDDESTFIGHYSLGNDNYIDHTIESTNNHVWHVEPNPHFQDDIISDQPMYLISSIPVDSINTMQQFKSLDVVTSHPEKMSMHTSIDLSAQCRQYRYQYAIPTAMTHYGRQFITASSIRHTTPPLPLSAMCAFTGDAAVPTQTMALTVYTKVNGKIYKSTKEYAHRGTISAETLPRYIKHPDPNAFLMTINYAGTTHLLPLTTTPDRQGAYWWGGLTGTIETPDTQIPANASDAPVSEESTIYVSAPVNPMSALSAITPGCDTIIGFASALQPPVGADFGQYPLYTFAHDGVWALNYDEAKTTFTHARMLNDDPCTNPQAITSAGCSVIYATGKSIKSISGSKTTTITHNLSSIAQGISTLPYIDSALGIVNAKLIKRHLDEILSSASIIYDETSRHLIIAPSTCDYAIVKADDSELWTFTDMHIRSKLKFKRRDMAVDVYNNILHIDYQDRQLKGMLATRPIKAETPLTGINMTSAEILGCFDGGHVSTVIYGTNDLKDWHLTASARSATIEEYNGRHYRYLCIIMFTELTDDEYLHGVQLAYRQ